MITVPENLIEGFYQEGIKHVSETEINELVEETRSRAKSNGTSIQSNGRVYRRSEQPKQIRQNKR